jgi:hypothetical protein
MHAVGGVNLDYAKLEMKLRRIVEKRLREGWLVLPTTDVIGTAYGESKCCILGSTLVGERNGINYHAKSRRRLGVSERVVFAVEHGFMGWTFEFREFPEAVAIGARIRRIYCDDNGAVE